MIDVNKLKAGDKVRRISADVAKARVGEVYTLEIKDGVLCTETGLGVSLYPSRWEHVDDASETTEAAEAPEPIELSEALTAIRRLTDALAELEELREDAEAEHEESYSDAIFDVLAAIQRLTNTIAREA